MTILFEFEKMLEEHDKELVNRTMEEVFKEIDEWATKWYGKNWYNDEALGDIKELTKIIKRNKE